MIRYPWFFLWVAAILFGFVVDGVCQEKEKPAIAPIPGVPTLNPLPPAPMPSDRPGQPRILIPGYPQPLPGYVPSPPKAPNPVAVPADAVEFDFDLAAGHTYRFVNELVIRAQLPGQGIREMTLEQQARFDVAARADGKPGRTIKARTERLKLEIRSGAEQLSYDSLDPEDRQTRLGKHLRSAPLQWVEVDLNRDLRVVASRSGGPENQEPIEGMPTFGTEELVQLLTSLPQGFPDKKKRAGEIWNLNGSRFIGEDGSVEFDVTYRFAGDLRHEGTDCHLVQLSGSVSGVGELSEAMAMLVGASPPAFRGGSLSGRILFDPSESVVRQRERNLNYLLEIPGDLGSPPSQIPLEQRETLRFLQKTPSSL